MNWVVFCVRLWNLVERGARIFCSFWDINFGVWGELGVRFFNFEGL